MYEYFGGGVVVVVEGDVGGIYLYVVVGIEVVLVIDMDEVVVCLGL